MRDCPFEFEGGLASGTRPKVIKKAYQVSECSWDDTLEGAYLDKEKVGQLDGVEGPYRNFNGITSKFGCHFILKIDKILMKDKFYNVIVNGLSLLPSLRFQSIMDIGIPPISGIESSSAQAPLLFQPEKKLT